VLYICGTVRLCARCTSRIPTQLRLVGTLGAKAADDHTAQLIFRAEVYDPRGESETIARRFQRKEVSRQCRSRQRVQDSRGCPMSWRPRDASRPIVLSQAVATAGQ